MPKRILPCLVVKEYRLCQVMGMRLGLSGHLYLRKSITVRHFCFPEASDFFGTTQTGEL